MEIEKAILAFIFGTIFGSFFNVVIYRLPNNISIIKPVSHCPVCNERIKWYHNVPLLSYVFLRGKCAYCGAKIPFSYFAVELLTGTAFLVLLVKDGFGKSYFFDLLIFSVLLIQSIIDFKYMEVQAILNDILLIAGVFYIVFDYSFSLVVFSICISTVFLLLYFFYRNKLGFGDVKIFIALSMFFGYDLLYVILISSILGIFFAFIFSVIKKVKFFSIKLPFIPYIFFGVLIYWLILFIMKTSTLMNFGI